MPGPFAGSITVDPDTDAIDANRAAIKIIYGNDPSKIDDTAPSACRPAPARSSMTGCKPTDGCATSDGALSVHGYGMSAPSDY